MARDKEMQAEVEKSEEENKKTEEAPVIDDPKDETTKKSDGKLVVAEEIAEGHVSWAAGKISSFTVCPDRILFTLTF